MVFRNRFSKSEESQLILPDYIQELKDVPKHYGLPANAKLYSFTDEGTKAFVIRHPVRAKEAMPFSGVEQVIELMHRCMKDNEGLIEVSNGLTPQGKPFVYSIIKRCISGGNGEPRGNDYTINMDIDAGKEILHIIASFTEVGTTGMRDNTIFSLFVPAMMKEYPDIDVGTIMNEHWSRDPYDTEYKKGFLMNQSETREYDELFPKHPLSEAREFIKFVIANN